MAIKGKRNLSWSCWKDLEMSSLNVDMVYFILRKHKTCVRYVLDTIPQKWKMPPPG